jgi:hypothetical protein
MRSTARAPRTGRGPHPRRAAAARAHADGSNAPATDGAARQAFRKKLREGELDDKEIEIEWPQPAPTMESWARPAWRRWPSSSRACSATWAGRRKTRKLKIAEAMKLLTDEEAGKLVNEDEIRAQALQNAEQNGIVFIDEIDKVASRGEGSGADVSRQGVQRDLLPLVEGTTVNTKYGMVKTDHILFIASGAFHLAKPSDLIPELQGRFPIRVELDSLSVEDFEAILTQTDASLVAVPGAAGHRGRDAGVQRRRHHPPGADRLRRQRAHREHRCAPPVHRDGAPAGRGQLRRHAPAGQRCTSTPPTSISAWPAQPDEDLSRYIL